MTLKEIASRNSESFNKFPQEFRHISSLVECNHRIIELEERKKQLKRECDRQCRTLDQRIIILQAELIKPLPSFNLKEL